MGNHKTKRQRALEHNRLYAINRGETVTIKQPKQAVNVGTIGHVDHSKTTLSEAIKKAESKPRNFWQSICGRFRSFFRRKKLGAV
ncbi:Tr-type G domain-containing protein [Shewanella violacea]